MRFLKLIVFMLIILVSCINDSILKNNEEKDINISNLSNRTIQGLDKVQLFCGKNTKTSYKYKIIVYFNGMCSVCIAEMLEWQNLFKTWIHNMDVEILFITYTNEMEILQFYFEKDKIDFPIYFDVDSTFIKNNGIVNSSHLAFIVDSTNKIVYKDDPLKDSMTKNDFINTISKIK